VIEFNDRKLQSVINETLVLFPHSDFYLYWQWHLFAVTKKLCILCFFFPSMISNNLNNQLVKNTASDKELNKNKEIEIKCLNQKLPLCPGSSPCGNWCWGCCRCCRVQLPMWTCKLTNSLDGFVQFAQAFSFPNGTSPLSDGRLHVLVHASFASPGTKVVVVVETTVTSVGDVGYPFGTRLIAVIARMPSGVYSD